MKNKPTNPCSQMIMALFPYLCQHISCSRRLTTSQGLGIFALSLSCVGCWQEVRYEPSEPVAEATPKVTAVESEGLIQEIMLEQAPEELFGGTEPEVVKPAEGVPVSAVEEPVLPSVEANSPGVEGAEGGALAVWEMSSAWSMAAALQAKGRDVESFGERLEFAEERAMLLGIDLPDLPTYEAGTDRLPGNLTFLLEDAGPRLVSELSVLQSADHAALAELATKTHVLLLSYTPSSTRLEPVIVAIRQAAESSGLPESVWSELIDLLTTRAEFKQVKAAIYRLHRRAESYLGGRSD